jgi:uncharacterized membrane protein
MLIVLFVPCSVFFYCYYLNKYAVVVLFIVIQFVITILFNKLFINYTSDSFLIKNSIPMGIEKKKKKIPLPRPAPQVLPLLQVEVLLLHSKSTST